MRRQMIRSGTSVGAQYREACRARSNAEFISKLHQALQELGWAVARDASVISFDDSDLAGWLRPSLTSAAIPYFEMGRRSVELLLGSPGSTEVHRVSMQLNRRESVGPPAP